MSATRWGASTSGSRNSQIQNQADVVDRISPALKVCGALRLFRTTPLLSVEQGMNSMKKAGKVREAYSPPLTVSVIDQPTRSARPVGR